VSVTTTSVLTSLSVSTTSVLSDASISYTPAAGASLLVIIIW
jgi:hypothetical protein